MIPTWLQALALGVVQGLTEFVPVSSSGHLVLVPYLAGWERPGLAFDVALHLGTAGAIILYFRAELFAMARGVVTGGRGPDGRLHRRLALLLVVGSAPVAVVGLTLEEMFEEAFATPPAAAAFLFLTAAILVAGERWRARRVRRAGRRDGRSGSAGVGAAEPGAAEGGAARIAGAADAGAPGGGAPDAGAPDAGAPDAGAGGASAASTGRRREPGTTALPLGEDPEDPGGRTLAGVGVRHALIVGASQSLALFPGVSRSGTTIMAGVAAGLTREAATRFSFLLALPALLGAGLLSLPDLAEPSVYRGWEISLGVLAAFVSSYAAIAFLVAFVSRRRLSGFAAYCAAVGALGLLVALVRG